MERRGFLQLMTGTAAGMALTQAGGGAPAPKRQPNIVLIMTDDQGWGDIHSHGNAALDTPVLDRLAGQGARFDRFYVSAVCAPTRASLLTGRHHLRCGVSGVTRGLETMRAGEVTLAEVLRGAGYATGIFGKWHNGMHFPQHPNGQGFEEFLGFCAGHWNNYFDTTLERNGRPAPTRGFITDVLTDAALEFIERHRARPFFCYVPYNAPHGPFQAPDRQFDKYKAHGLADREACVYAMVENIDDNVGRLLERLDALDLARDTIVIFLTDNGPNTERFNGGMRGRKGSPDEGGVRVPFFIRWPGRIEAGRTVARIAAHIDVFPTLLDLCGLPAPSEPRLDGVSLAPLLTGEARDWPDRLLFSHWAQGENPRPFPGAVRTQRHRLVQRKKGGPELYDMTADPAQANDIATEAPDVVRRLSEAYDAWFKDVTREPIVRPPIAVGHAEAPVVECPAPEAYFEGNVTFKGKAGWANDWLTNWTSTDDAIWWELDVVRPGRFDVALRYTSPAKDVGARVRVGAGAARVEGVVERAHDPAPLPSPDRVPRGEVYEKVWASLELGALELPQGRTRLLVKALTKPGASVMDLKAVVLRRSA